MMFRKEHGKINATSLVERVSRYAVVMRNEDRQSKPTMEALINGLAPLPADARQSIIIRHHNNTAVAQLRSAIQHSISQARKNQDLGRVPIS